MVRAKRNRRARVRNSVAAATVGALAAGIVSIPAAPANAADTITAADQPYFAYYGLDRARAKGYTGEGVTIAMIDGKVDTSVPELAGADITVKIPCTIIQHRWWKTTARVLHQSSYPRLTVLHQMQRSLPIK